jgi:hypothetical protein
VSRDYCCSVEEEVDGQEDGSQGRARTAGDGLFNVARIAVEVDVISCYCKERRIVMELCTS